MIIEELARINRKFSSGRLVNRTSLEFAVNAVIKTKNWQEQAAYIG